MDLQTLIGFLLPQKTVRLSRKERNPLKKYVKFKIPLWKKRIKKNKKRKVKAVVLKH